MSNMPFGLYEYKNTIFHNSSSFTKILSLIVLIVAICISDNLFLYLFWILIIVLCFYLSKCDYKTILNSIFKMKYFCLIILLMNFCFFDRSSAYFTFLFISPSYLGLIQGIKVVGRTLIIVLFGSVLLSCASPLDITKGISMLLLPLQYLGINVYEVSMILSISLSFIPILYSESETLRKAQLSRGAYINNKGLINKAKSIIPFVVPLFICAFKRADNLSLALESRGIEYQNKKLKFDVLFNRYDYYILIGCVLILLFVVFVRGI